MPAEFRDGGDVGDFFGVGVECEALRDFPDEDLTILGSGGDNTVVKGVPERASVSEGWNRGRGEWTHQSVSRTAAVCPLNRGI